MKINIKFIKDHNSKNTHICWCKSALLIPRILMEQLIKTFIISPLNYPLVNILRCIKNSKHVDWRKNVYCINR